MSYRFVTNASLAITTPAGVASTVSVAIRFYKVVPKRAPNGLLTVDGEAPTEYRVTRGAGLGSTPRNYVYFTYRGETCYVEVDDAAYFALPGSTIVVTTVAAPAPAPAPAATEPAPAPAPAATEPAAKAKRKARA